MQSDWQSVKMRFDVLAGIWAPRRCPLRTVNLYYSVSISIYNALCLFNVRARRHVIVLEAKVRLLVPAFSFLVSRKALLRP